MSFDNTILDLTWWSRGLGNRTCLFLHQLCRTSCSHSRNHPSTVFLSRNDFLCLSAFLLIAQTEHLATTIKTITIIGHEIQLTFVRSVCFFGFEVFPPIKACLASCACWRTRSSRARRASPSSICEWSCLNLFFPTTAPDVLRATMFFFFLRSPDSGYPRSVFDFEVVKFRLPLPLQAPPPHGLGPLSGWQKECSIGVCKICLFHTQLHARCHACFLFKAWKPDWLSCHASSRVAQNGHGAILYALVGCPFYHRVW